MTTAVAVRRDSRMAFVRRSIAALNRSGDSSRRWLARAMLALSAALWCAPADGQVVISQIYGAGSNAGATWNRDYVELYNRGTSTVNIGGWTIQYAASTGSSWSGSTQPITAGKTIAPGQYFLVQMTTTGTIGTALPTPDFAMTTAIDMAAAAGKVALCNDSTGLTGTTPSTSAIVDFVGYGTGTNAFEGASPAPAPSATNGTFRSPGGIDTGWNGMDFAAGVAIPRNTAVYAAQARTPLCVRVDQNTNAASADGVIGINEYSPLNSMRAVGPHWWFNAVGGNGITSDGGGTGFGGRVGFGQLFVHSDLTNLYVALRPGATLGTDIAVIYLDTRAGGFDDSTMNDTGDSLRSAITNLGSFGNDVFPPGFSPDFAVTVDQNSVAAFELNGGSLNFLGNNTSNAGANALPREIAIPLSSLGGLQGGQAVDALVAYVSTTGFLSDESIPQCTSINYGGNPGSGATGTYNSFARFILNSANATEVLDCTGTVITLATVNAAIAAGEYGTGNVQSWTGGGTGFGGILGAGTIYMDTDGAGLKVGFLPGAAMGAGTDVVVVYLDTRNGGFNDSTIPTDTGSIERRAISDLGAAGNDAFPHDMRPDYAIAFSSNGVFLFELGSTLTQLTGTGGVTLGTAVSGSGTGVTAREIYVPWHLVGNPAHGTAVHFFAGLCNGTNSFLSNESIPASGGLNGAANPGTSSTGTYTGFGRLRTYASNAAGPSIMTRGNGADLGSAAQIRNYISSVGNMTYQWRKGGVPINIPGIEGNDPLPPGTSATIAGDYDAYSCAVGTPCVSGVFPNVFLSQTGNNTCGTYTPNAAALTIPSTGGQLTGDTRAPFMTNDGATSCGTAGGVDGYYLFTPSVAGPWTIQTCAPTGYPTTTANDTIVSVHTACPATLANTVASGCDDDGCGTSGGLSRIASLTLTPGTPYVIRVAQWSTTGARNAYVLRVSLAGTANDICGTATVLNVSGGSATASASNAGALDDGPSPSCGTTSRDVWFTFATGAAQSGNWVIDTCGSAIDTILSVYSGWSCGSLSEMACNDDATSGTCASTPQSSTTVTLAASTQYWVRVSSKGAGASGGSITLNVQYAAPPANDNCATASTVTMVTTAPFITTVAGSNVFADTALDATQPSMCATAGKDVFYNVTIPSLGAGLPTTNNWVFRTCSGTTQDTVLQVLSACGGTELGCNDDTSGCGSGTQSSVTLSLTQGANVRVRVASKGASPSGGAFTLTITPAPPSNDDCAGALALSSGVAVITNNLGATTDSLLPTCQTNTKYDLWYSYTPCTSGTIYINTCGTRALNGTTGITDTVLSVYTGTCASPTQLVCFDDYTVAPLNCVAGNTLEAAGSFTGTAGVTYLIRVAAYGSATVQMSGLRVLLVAPADNVNPTIVTCAQDQSGFADANCQASVPDFTFDVTANDNCTPSGSLVITQSPSAGTLVGLGTTVVTITVKDAANNQATCNANFHVTDNTPPSITCPGDTTVGANASCQYALADFTGAATAADNCGPVTVTQSPAIGTLLGLGTHTITLTATDGASLTASCTFDISVTDQTPPSLACGPDDSAFVDANCQASVPDFTAGATASDNCGAVTLSQAPAAGTLVGVGVHTVTVTATDGVGNFSTCDNTFTVTDNTPPSLTCGPDDSAFVDANCQASVPDFTAGASASDNCPGVTLSQSPVAGTLVGVGVHTITVTATDGSGNTATCDNTFTVTDNTPPSLTCGPDDSAFVDANCQASVPDFTAGASASDNCPGVALSQSPAAGTLVGIGVHTVTVTATDGSGNTATCDNTFTVTDNTPPSVSCGPDDSAFVDANCQAAVPDFTAGASASDNCPGVTLSQSPTAGTLVGVGVHTVTVTATDGSGNTATCDNTFTVTDNTPPSVSCGPDDSAFVDANCQASVPDFTAGASASDNCPGVTLSQSPTAGTLVGVGVHTITVTATDGSGNFSTCENTFTVTDNTPPDITACAGPVTQYTSGRSGERVNPCERPLPDFTGDVTAGDNCTPGMDLVITQSPAAGTLVGLGAHTVTITVTDGAGNQSTCDTTYTLIDDVPPTITCGPDDAAFVDANCQAAVPDFTGGATALDDCGAPSLTQSPAAGTLVGVGVHTITVTATDGSSNTATCDNTFTVTDNTPPSLTCGPDDSAFVDANCQASVPDFTAGASASDNCPGVTLSQSPASGTLVGVGVHTVTVTATDGSGNFSTCENTFTVTDNTPPTITCGMDGSAFVDANCQAAVPDFTAGASASDNCPGVTLSQSPAAGTLVGVGVHTITVTATDGSGNFSTCENTFAVTDNTPPSLTCGPNDSAFADANCQAAVPDFTAGASASDNCPGVTLTQSPAAGTLVGVGVHTITVTATDGSGNFSTCENTFTVTDNTPPTIVTCASPQTIPAVANCEAPVPDFTGGVVAHDNCTPDNGLVITQSPVANFIVGTGTHTITITVADLAGNFDTCTTTLTVQDDPPYFTGCPVDIITTAAPGQCRAPATWTPPQGLDGCDPNPTVVSSHNPGDLFPVGVTTVTYTVTDNSSQSATCSFTVTVLSGGPPAIVYVDDSWTGTALGADPDGPGPAQVFGCDSFATIQEGVDGVAPCGDVIVYAGLYAENVTVGQCVNIKGPFAGVCAHGASLSRGAEAVVVPAVNDPLEGIVFYVTSSNVTIDGLTIDADNTAIGGGIAINGADSNAANCVSNGSFEFPTATPFVSVDHVHVINNILLNANDVGVNFYEDGLGAYNANRINCNRFDNIPGVNPIYGYTRIGVLVYNDWFGTIDQNWMTRVGIGVQTGNNHLAGDASSISSNHVEADALGIWHNLHYQNAADWSIFNNFVTSVPGFEHDADGIYVSSIQTAVTATVDNNDCRHLRNGVLAWNNPTTRTVSVTDHTSVDCDYGIRLRNIDDIYGPGSPTSLLVTNATISGGIDGVWVEDHATGTDFVHMLAQQMHVSGCSGAGGLVTGSRARLSVRASLTTFTSSPFGLDVSGGFAMIETTNLTGNTSAGLRVRDGATVDAGDCAGNNYSGLGTGSGPAGSSSGGNILSGYGFNNASPHAVDNQNAAAQPYVLAQLNDWGAGVGDDIEDVIHDDTDSALFSQVVYSQDPITVKCPPAALVQCPADVPAGAGTLSEFVAQGGVVSASGASISYSDAPPTLSGDGSITRTYTITDDCGQTTTCDQTITVDDTTAPTIHDCAPPTSANADAFCSAVVPDFTGGVSASDNCATSVISVSQSPAAGSAVGVGVHTVTLTVSDGNGNTSTCDTTFTVSDATPPTITCGMDGSASADANCQAAIPDFMAGATAGDNCPGVTLSQSPAAGTLVGLGVHTITVTATDGAGNTATCENTFTVSDTTPPDIMCGMDGSATVDANCQAPVPDFMAGATTSDNCGPVTLSQSPAVGTLVTVGVHTITVTATDGVGNFSTCTNSFTVTDTTPPTIMCGMDGSATVDANCQAPVPDFMAGATAHDNCPGVTLSQSPAVGTLVTVGVHTITVTAVDQSGNTATCENTFTVTDTTPPTIMCGMDGSASADANCQAPVPDFMAGATAHDNCPGVTLSQSPAVGTLVGVGVHTITVTATDGAGNTATCENTFTVTDTTPPDIMCGMDGSATVDANCQAPVPDFMAGATAHDNCGPVTLSQSPAVGTLVTVGVHTITVTATDGVGNFSTCTNSFTVTDTTPPTITCGMDGSASADANCQAPVPDFMAGATAHDNCPGVTLSQSPAVGTLVGLGVHSITVTAVDQSGNTATCTNTLTVTDTTPPSLVCPVPIVEGTSTASRSTVGCTAVLPDFTAHLDTHDNCTPYGSLIITQSPPAGTEVGLGTHSVTITVTDAYGNTTSCVTSYTLVDDTAPTISCPPSVPDLIVDASCQATLPSYTHLALAKDNCVGASRITITQSPPAGTVVTVGPVVVTLTATDTHGNSSSCNFTVHVKDTTAPTISVCPPSRNVSVGADCLAIMPDLRGEVVAHDNCTADPDLVISQAPAPGSTFALGATVTVTFTVTDLSGNPVTCTTSVTAVDTTAPSVTCGPALSAYADGFCTALVLDFISISTYFDNCTATGDLVVTQSPAAGTSVGLGVHTITVTVTDGSGNSESCTTTFTVTDNTPPSVTCGPSQGGIADSSCQAQVPDFISTSTYDDNCTMHGDLIVTQSPAAGASVGLGTHTITVTVTDASGNSNNCTTSFIVTDISEPFVSCGPAQSEFADSSCSALVPDFTSSASYSDNCTAHGDLIVTQSPAAGTSVGLGVHTITITVTDGSGNSESCTTSFTVTDFSAPHVTCGPAQSAFADSSCSSLVPDFISSSSYDDNCTAHGDLIVTQSPAAGTSVGLGVHTITITVTDGAGNSESCTTSFTVTDNTPPSVTCGPSQSAFADGFCSAPVPDFTGTTSYFDNCTAHGDLIVTQSPAAGSSVGLGTHTVTVTVTDGAGNSESCTTSFSVTDNTPPSVTCGNPQGAPADSLCSALVPDFISTSSFFDNCTASGDLIVTQAPAAGTPVGLGTHTITVTVTDASGNSESCTTTFSVTDISAPNLTCGPAQSAFADSFCTALVPDFISSSSYSDNCTAFGDLIVTQSPAAGTSVGLGTHTVTVTVTDGAGNSESCTTSFTVTDNTAPSITCGSAQSAFADSSCQAMVPDFIGSSSYFDNCTAFGDLTVSQSPAAGTSVGLGVHTITITVTDGAGNSNSCTTSFTVTDNTPPSVTCGSAQSDFADIDCSAFVPDFTLTSSYHDNCTTHGDLIVTQSPAAGTSVGVGVHTITVTVADGSGNSNFCTTTFTVTDNTPPTISSCTGQTDFLTGVGCVLVLPDLRPDVVANDNCTATGDLVITQSPAPGTLLGVGTYTITFTVTDGSGNFDTCTRDINVTDPDTIIYVNHAAVGLNDGTSWANAFTTLQAALAATCDADEIWVAKGTYRPDASGGSRFSTFYIPALVRVYGGFNATETLRSQRSVVANPTFLSGDLNGDDGSALFSDNSYSVVTFGAGLGSVLDGFTVLGGNANGTATPNQRGAGVNAQAGNPILANCRLVQNFALLSGGGIHADSSGLRVVNCLFLLNACPLNGGAASASGGSPSFMNCIFNNNLSYGGDGAAYHGVGAAASFTNCTLFNNQSAASITGGLRAVGGSLVVTSCILWNNVDSTGVQEGSQLSTLGGAISLNYTLVKNLTGLLGGTGNISTAPLFRDENGPDNVIGTLDDDFRLFPISPGVDAGSNLSVPTDFADLDQDGNTAELTPLDIKYLTRFINVPFTPDTGAGTAPIIDMGAHENTPCVSDLNNDGIVGTNDLVILLGQFGQSVPPGTGGDINGDGLVNTIDLTILLGDFGCHP